MTQVKYVTENGLKKLKEELLQLESIERPSISRQIAEARDKGDLSENAEYDAAKEAQGLLEMRIAKLKDTIANSRIIADMDHPQPGSPDGMKIDEEGHLYVTGATGVWVFEPNGELLGVVATPERPANCAWGDADRKSLYITAQTSLYRVRTKVAGAKRNG